MLVLALRTVSDSHAGEILPGVTFFETKDRLNGSLLFLFSDDPTGYWTNRARTWIYEYELGSKKLRKLTSTVGGIFVTSADGKMLAVAYEHRG